MAFQFPFALRTKRKKTFHLDDISEKEVIGQGAFGAVFITRYNVARKPAETVVVKKLLSTTTGSPSLMTSRGFEL